MAFSTRNARLLVLGGMAFGASAWDVSKISNIDFSNLNLNLTNAPTAACDYFKQNYPNMTVLPTDANYTAENEGKCFRGMCISLG